MKRPSPGKRPRIRSFGAPASENYPLIVYLKRNCLDDGPGIRTVVFFKGCPLSCVWCHNPECAAPRPQLSFDPKACVACGECEKACPEDAIRMDDPRRIDREKCALHFDCVAVCPSGALSRLGAPMGREDIMRIVERDVPFYRNSGGGVTLSGGEPTMHAEFCSGLLQDCKTAGVHTLLETCGAFDFGVFQRSLLPWTDMIYIDLKLMDPAGHRQHCGQGNDRILENIRLLGGLSKKGSMPILPRIPLVPGITAEDDNLASAADFLKSCGFHRIALLPYNPTWHGKAESVGILPTYEHAEWMTCEELDRCKAHFAGFEIEGL